ncbi:MAG: hypothetical protein M1127_03235 [Patescibacteria group bacterium]|nr:hypothetical protein [Patescibacteria group bacterium]
MKNDNIGVSLDNFILAAEMAEGKAGGKSNHNYSAALGFLRGCRKKLSGEGLNLNNMTFAQLKQKYPVFLNLMIGCIVELMEFGKILNIPELKF